MTALALVVALTVLISAACSLFEATLFSTRVGVLEAETAGGRHAGGARRLLAMKQNIAEPTSAILILNTLANTGGAAIAGMYAADVLGPQRVPLFSAVLTVLILFAAEIVPKTIGATGWRWAWPYVVWPLDFLQRALRPAVWLTRRLSDLLTGDRASAAVTEEEIRAVIRMGGAQGELSAGELRLLTAVFDFDETYARQVMLPRRDIVSFDASWPLARCLEVANRTRHTRYPLCEGSLDNVLGIIHIKDLLGLAADASLDLRSVARPLRTIPDSLPISKLLRQMQTTRQHMAAVADEYGAMVGLITLENILEQLVGAVRDEFDDESPDIVPEGDGAYKVRGALALDSVNRELEISLESEEADSLSGLLAETIGRMPRVGDRANFGAVEAEVVEARAGRAEWIRLRIRREREEE